MQPEPRRDWSSCSISEMKDLSKMRSLSFLTAPANVLVMQSINPMFSAMFSYILLGETMLLRTVITCVICFAVVIWIFISEASTSNDGMAGNIFALLSSILIGEFFALIRVASCSQK